MVEIFLTLDFRPELVLIFDSTDPDSSYFLTMAAAADFEILNLLAILRKDSLSTFLAFTMRILRSSEKFFSFFLPILSSYGTRHVREEEEEGDRISLKHALLKDLSNQSNITFIHDKYHTPTCC